MTEKKEKKIKIEISKMAFIFLILFGLSLLIWSFVIGVWMGIRIGSKSEKEEIAIKEQSIVPKESIPSQPTMFNETFPSSSVKITPTSTTIKETAKKKEVVLIHKKSVKSTSASITKKNKKKRNITAYKKSVKYKTPFYSIQIGAFSKKETAQRFKKIAKTKGYYCFIRKLNINGKVLYKVYIGKYHTKEQAKKYIFKIAKTLNVKNPFIVKIK